MGLLWAAVGQAQASAPAPQAATVSAALVPAGGSLAAGRFVSHFEDAGRSLGMDAVRAGSAALPFLPVQEERPNFGYSTSAHWLRLAVDPGSAPLDLLLEIAMPSLDSIDLYTPLGAAYGVQHAGDQVPWAERGYRPARFFLLAWGVLLVFIVLSALRNFALVPSNFLTMNGLHFGVAFDVLLLSFGLGDRINLLRREKLEAQAALLESTQRQERELAQRVDERTVQLEDANRKLRIEAQERDALVQKLAEDETRMRHLAQHDALTGLPNRLPLQERFALATEYAKRNEHKIAVMLLDLDHFKELNDTRGHAAGAWTLSASIGVALYPDDGASLGDLLKLADAAMYSDKAQRTRRGVHVPVKPA